MARLTFAAAQAELVRRDPVMAGLAERAGRFRLAKPADGHFEALVESIMYQQLAGAAAAAIHRRVVDALGGSVTPARVLRAPEQRLRAAGLSGGKLASIRDVAAKVRAGAIPLDGIERLGDDEIVSRLSTARGIGRWTAEMFLIFQLRRLDVWPVDDYGVRKGYALAHGLPDLPKPRDLQTLGDRYRGVRTVAAWYCWRAVELGRRAAAVPLQPTRAAPSPR